MKYKESWNLHELLINGAVFKNSAASREIIPLKGYASEILSYRKNSMLIFEEVYFRGYSLPNRKYQKSVLTIRKKPSDADVVRLKNYFPIF